MLRLKALVAWCMVTGWRLRNCSGLRDKNIPLTVTVDAPLPAAVTDDGLCGGQNCFRTVCYCGFHWRGGANAQL